MDYLNPTRPYQQCTRCVMDTTDPEITFDANGWCNHCTGFFERLSYRIYRGEESDRELRLLVEKMKRAGRGKKYDCVIGVSGGVDSSYAAWVAVQHGLRPLAVHMDNGWNSEEATRNIINVARRLGIDYQSYVLDYEEFKDLQLAFLKASVPEIETPTDMAIPAALHKVAAGFGVKYIISGGNYATEGILPRMWHYNAKDMKYLKAIHRRFGKVKLKSFPTFGWRNEAWYKLAHGIRIIYLLNYVPYRKLDAMKLLEEKLQWKYYGGKHYESKYTGFVQSYILPEKFHLDYRKATFSTQICAGEMTREDALTLLQKKTWTPEGVARESEYLAKKLGIAPGEFQAMMQEKPLSYLDYPNSFHFLERLYGFYRKWMG